MSTPKANFYRGMQCDNHKQVSYHTLAESQLASMLKEEAMV
ncbi:hypothetical protein [Pseudoalteromonas piscicida]|nr:hypothetical protein [Pseudoalteromonas piscicida]